MNMVDILARTSRLSTADKAKIGADIRKISYGGDDDLDTWATDGGATA